MNKPLGTTTISLILLGITAIIYYINPSLIILFSIILIGVSAYLAVKSFKENNKVALAVSIITLVIPIIFWLWLAYAFSQAESLLI